MHMGGLTLQISAKTDLDSVGMGLFNQDTFSIEPKSVFSHDLSTGATLRVAVSPPR